MKFATEKVVAIRDAGKMPKLIYFYSFFNTVLFKLFIALLFLALCNINFVSSAFAQERVYTYSSIIKILSNRSLDVTETITVNVENKKIRHGIYRDFETSRVNQDNEKVNVSLKILEVKRNGVREKFHTRKQGNKIRVFFGSKDKIVNKGIQTYEFRFITNNQLNAYDNKDEFYWNASGNKWSMPIFRVEATVILPSQVKKKSISYNAYSGYTGVNKQDYITSFINSHTINFALNKKYSAGNGLTIAISWPKGFIDPPLPLNTDSKNTRIDEPILPSKSDPVAASAEAIPNKKSILQNKQDNTSNNKIKLVVSNLQEVPENMSEKTVPPNAIVNSDTKKNIFQKINTILVEKISALTLNHLIGLIGLLLLLLYFLLIRLYLKNSSKSDNKDYIENNESIPDNLSPASIRYIYEMGYDDRTFTIALINIAVKGHIDIINNGKSYKIERRDFSSAEKLSDDETLLLDTLMEDKLAIHLTSKNHQVIRNAMTQHQNILEKDHKDKYFATNKKWFNLGIAIVGVTLIAIAFTEYSMSTALLTLTLISAFTFVSFMLSFTLLKLLNFYNNFDLSFISNSTLFKSANKTKEAYFFAIITIETGMVLVLTNYLDLVNIITIGIASFVCAVFSDYLISPNTAGKNIINKIVHLKDFITHGKLLDMDTEYDSIQISQQISAFDNYLPYTIALGVETEWGDHYSLLFNNNENTDDVLGYSPHWYHGSGWNENNTTDFCESLSSKFSISAASAAKIPQHDFENDYPHTGTKH